MIGELSLNSRPRTSSITVTSPRACRNSTSSATCYEPMLLSVTHAINRAKDPGPARVSLNPQCSRARLRHFLKCQRRLASATYAAAFCLVGPAGLEHANQTVMSDRL